LEPIIRLEGVVKAFDGEPVVRDLSLDIQKGEFLTILGPSGCGKTTTLRMLAGFEEATEGRIFLEGEDVAGKKPNERDVNTVFQSYALFPHLNVEKNIAFGLVEKKVKKQEIAQRVAEMAKLVMLDGLEKRMPDQLSGGQKQRVAIARALINRPKVLLLDEPLGALDYKLRKQMQIELKHLQKTLGITFVFVTHDQEEALTMSDRIVVMNEGRIEQIGTPQEIYNKPQSKFVAEFIGEMNTLYAYIEDIKGDEMLCTMEFGFCKLHSRGFKLEEIVYICVRPESLRISTDETPGFHIFGVVREHVFIGAFCKTIVILGNGMEAKVLTPQTESLYPIGETVNIYWKEENGIILHTKEDKIYDIIETAVKIS
jgi:spermidine/putrescine transport system ATP-binding protein